MAYQPDSLKKEDLKAIESIRWGLLGSIDKAISHLKVLEDSLQAYKESVQSSVDYNLEYADIFSRWNEPDRHSSTYGLPGIMATTVASYDTETLKKDNERMALCKEKKAEAERQRDAYFKSIVKSFAALQSDLNNGVGDFNQRLFMYIEQLNKGVN